MRRPSALIKFIFILLLFPGFVSLDGRGFSLLHASGQGETFEPDREDPASGNDMAEAVIYKEIYNPARFSETPLDLLKKRDLKVYYSHRQYPGSPPVIPHRIPDDMYGKKNSCPECHRDGGYSPTLEAFAPVTPHPRFENCVQCHVPKRTNTLFRETLWKSVAPPKIGRSALPGSPPPIPHSTQFRENCSACHTGPASVFEIHTPHPERINCVQCHVPQNVKGFFTRRVVVDP